MPDRSKVEVFSQQKHMNKVSELVQTLHKDRNTIPSKDKINLPPKEQASDIRASIVKKETLPQLSYGSITTTNKIELFGF
jgi:hypothetical protein